MSDTARRLLDSLDAADRARLEAAARLARACRVYAEMRRPVLLAMRVPESVVTAWDAVDAALHDYLAVQRPPERPDDQDAEERDLGDGG